MFISGSDDKQLKIWQIKEREPDKSQVTIARQKTLPGHSDGVTEVSVSAGGTTMVSASLDKTIKLWQLEPQSPIPTFKNNSVIQSISLSNDGKLIASGDWQGNVNLWQLNGTLVKTIKCDSESVNAVKFHPQEPFVACAGTDGFLKLWDYQGNLVRTFCQDKNSSNCHQDKNKNNQEKQWRIDTIDFSGNGEILAGGTQKGTIVLWNSQGELIPIPNSMEHKSAIKSLAFSPTEDLLISSDGQGEVKLWNLSGEVINTIDDSTINKVVFAPDGSQWISLGTNVQIWDKDGSSNEILSTSPGVEGQFHPQGNLVAVAYKDGTVKVHHFKTKTDFTISHQGDSITDLSFTGDGNSLIVSDASGVITIYPLTVEKLIEQGCLWLDDYFSSGHDDTNSVCSQF